MAVVRRRQLGTEGDEPSEPENHGHCFYGHNDETMRKVWEIDRRKGKIRNGNEGSPDAIKEQEVDSRAPIHITNHYTELTALPNLVWQRSPRQRTICS